jgi:hypothetical protein
MLVNSEGPEQLNFCRRTLADTIPHFCHLPENQSVTRISLSLCAAVALSVAGCGFGQGQLRQQIFRPGPTQYQQQRAVKFDPYSEQERYAGPRDSTMRPRDYYQPNPEPTRGRWLDWGAPRFGFW